MGIISNFKDKMLKEKQTTTSTQPTSSFIDSISNGAPNHTGVPVNEQTALNFSAVYAAIRLLTETVSTLPIHLYERTENGERRIVEEHPLSTLLRKPNPEMTRNVFFEVLHGHIETYGKAFAEIVHNTKSGYPKALYPVMPNNIRIQRNKETKKLEYVYKPTGAVVPSWKMLHIPGFGYNGIDSYSPIQLARQTIGLGLASEEFQARYFSQGTQIGGFVQMENELSDEAFERFKQQINEKYKGLQNSHGLIILEDGAKYEPVKISMEDAQFLESRQFTIKEIARWFGVKPHMIGDLSDATFSNIEHQGMEAVRYTFRPRIVRWEEALNNKLIPGPEQNQYYFKFSMEGLLRGDVKTRYEAYRMGIQDGWLNADEVRRMEDLNPQPEDIGKAYFVPANMMNKKIAIEGNNLPQSNKEENKKIDSSVSLYDNIEDNRDNKETNNNEKLEQQNLEEQKQIESAENRREKTENYRNLMNKQVSNILEKEIEVIRNNIGLLDEGTETFITQIKEELEKVKEDIPNQLLPTFETIGEELIPSIKEELGKDIDVTENIDEFIKKYVDNFATRHNIELTTETKSVVYDSSYSDRKEKMEEQLKYWEKNKVEDIVNNEVVRSENAITKTAYAAMGIVKIKSMATFNDTCPFCKALHGKVIDVDGYFLDKGQNFQPKGATHPLIPSGNVSHPPYHKGCNCQIVAEK